MNKTRHSVNLFALVFMLLTFLLAGLVEAGPGVVLEGRRGPGKGKHIVFLIGDEEYRSEELMPQLAKILAVRQGFKCTLLFAVNKETGEVDPKTLDNIPGLNVLKEADLMVMFLRFRELPDEQMKYIIDYTNSGKPIIGLRTSTHAFNYTKNKRSPYAKYSFQSRELKGGYGRQVFGETWINHYGHHQVESTRGLIAEGMEDHPIVRGVKDIWGPSDVYGLTTLHGDCKPLIMGQVLSGMNPDDKPNPKKNLVPVAWTKTYTGDKGKTARIFTTTMGHGGDLKSEGFRRLLVNACFWAMGMEDKIPARSNVDLVGQYNPNKIGMGGHKTGVMPSDHELSNKLVVHTDKGKYTINKNIYGHFSEHLGRCIYEGLWVGEDSEIPNTRGIRNDVVEALKRIKVPVLRWPGGCFADEYHWKEGIGLSEERPGMINTHWGRVKETNAFGTHEFLDLCEQLGCDAYVAGNVGSGTVEEMQDWVEYMTSDADSEMANLRRFNGRDKPWRVKYFGVGNENWGCGGNMTPEYYADLYNRFQTYVRSYSGNRIVKIACGPGSENYPWITTVMERSHRRMNGISLHHYVRGTGNWTTKGSATKFDEKEWFALMKNTLTIYPLLEGNIAVMDRFDPSKRIGLYVDEWGTWWDNEPGTNPGFLYQQNTIRDAVSAGIFLNAFNKRCDRVKMANIAQTINVLQAMILTKGEKMILTPTYHVFEMYKVHQDATMLPVELNCSEYQFGDEKVPAIDVSASKDKSGQIHLTLCNLNPNKSAELICELQGGRPSSVTGRVLTADTMNAHNTFDKPETVRPAAFNKFDFKGNILTVTLPAKSVVLLGIK